MICNKMMKARITAAVTIIAIILCVFPAVSLADTSYEYIDAGGTLKTTTGTVTALSGSGSGEALTSGWYIVLDSGVTRSSSSTVSGDVHLILADGASLDINSSKSTSYAGIAVSEGNNLTIYGQQLGTGQLSVTGRDYGVGIGGYFNMDNGMFYNCGTITINGGKVTASDFYGAGIGGGMFCGGGKVIINGGVVNATSIYGAGIGSGVSADSDTVIISGGMVTAFSIYDAGSGCGIISISGGTVTATGSHSGAGIGSGADSDEDAGNITISGDCRVYASGENAQDIGAGSEGAGGTLSISDAAAVFLAHDRSIAPTAPAHTHLDSCTKATAASYGFSIPTAWSDSFGAYLRFHTLSYDNNGSERQRVIAHGLRLRQLEHGGGRQRRELCRKRRVHLHGGYHAVRAVDRQHIYGKIRRERRHGHDGGQQLYIRHIKGACRRRFYKSKLRLCGLVGEPVGLSGLRRRSER